MRGVPGRDELDAQLAQISQALEAQPEGEDALELAQQLADLHEARDSFEERFGQHRAERILTGLGFGERDFGKGLGQLSGGWRMRAALASLLLQDPELLLLDEPTSSVEPESEAAILAALLRLMKGRTTLVIAHRLSTIREADLIVVMDEGKIVETGSHDDLLTRDGAYARLHRMQFVES